MAAGETDSAIEMIRAAIDRGRQPFMYKTLGVALAVRGDGKDAAAAFKAALQNRSTSDGELNLDATDPDALTAAYFLDLITEERYVDHLRNSEKFACLPWFYVGQRREIEDDDDAAIVAYEKCVELGQPGTSHPVRTLARWRLKKLRE